jgi:hypothetical protein
MLSENIYGSEIHLPDCPPISTIDGYNLPINEQMWVRKELPDFFDDVEYDKEGNC